MHYLFTMKVHLLALSASSSQTLSFQEAFSRLLLADRDYHTRLFPIETVTVILNLATALYVCQRAIFTKLHYLCNLQMGP
jgi:hypothetical protein